MNVEMLRISREKIVRGTIATSVFLAATSTGVLVVREISKIRADRLKSEADMQSAGDGNYVTTPEEVKLRLG